VPAAPVDQGPLHQQARQREEVTAVLHRDDLGPEQTDHRFVDERRCLQDVILPFAAQLGARHASQRRVHRVHGGVAGFAIALQHAVQQRRKIGLIRQHKD
jgi:hypothetical protein